jgi:subtilisin family serine protease
MKMKCVSLIAALPLVALATPAQAQVAGEKIPNSYICVFNKNDVSRGNSQAEANRAAQSVGAQLKHVYSVALRGFAANMAPQAVENMKAKNPKIAYCEQDQVVTAIQFRAKGPPGSGSVQPAQETPWGIARVNGGAAGSFATAWVIDTGLDFTHPDLNVDTARSRSFLSNNTSPVDQNGHGTHVAGTIAAYDNTIGVVGVAPGAKVVAVRVLDRRGSGSNSGVIAGVDYVAQNGRPGDVANMSLGGGVSQALDSAVVTAASGGVRFALAAGNETDNANNHSPGRANGPNVYTVSAFSVGDKWASFSNYGNPPVDYAEPGVSIKSTWLNGGYNTISGTSMATPHLAGLLLAGAVRGGGNVSGDPDGNADVIGVH